MNYERATADQTSKEKGKGGLKQQVASVVQVYRKTAHGLSDGDRAKFTDSMLMEVRSAEVLSSYQYLPQKVQILSITCSYANTYLLSTKGFVYSWGDCSDCLGRDPKNKTKPEPLALRNIIKLAAGDHHVLALNYDGGVFVWGNNDHGQLGLGEEIDAVLKPDSEHPMEFPTKPIVQVYAGNHISYAVDNAGKVYIWGTLNKSFDEKGKKFFPTPTEIKNEKLSANPYKTIVVSKTNNGMIYDAPGSDYNRSEGHGGSNQKLQAQIDELMHINKNLNRQMKEKLSKFSANKVGDEIEKEKDSSKILLELKSTIQKIQRNRAVLEKQKKYIENEMNTLIQEIRAFDAKIDDAKQQEKALNSQLEGMSRSGNRSDPHEMKKKEDIRKSHEDHKNRLQFAKSEKQDKLERYRSEKMALDLTLKEEEQRQETFELIKLDQEADITKKILEDDLDGDSGGDTLKMVSELANIHESVKTTEIESLITHFKRSRDDSAGLRDIIEMSNDGLNDCKSKLESSQPHQEDPLFAFKKNILEVFEDNIRLRKKINQFTEVILKQADLKLTDSILKADDQPTKIAASTNKEKTKNIKSEKEKRAVDTRATVGGGGNEALDNSYRASALSNYSGKNTLGGRKSQF